MNRRHTTTLPLIASLVLTALWTATPSHAQREVYLGIHTTGAQRIQLLVDEFVCETATAPCYRLWSIEDRHPAMQRFDTGGASIGLELWRLSAEALVSVLEQEPSGLAIGRVELDDGRRVLGVLGEHFLCQRGHEITEYGGWRAYVAHRAAGRSSDSADGDGG